MLQQYLLAIALLVAASGVQAFPQQVGAPRSGKEHAARLQESLPAARLLPAPTSTLAQYVLDAVIDYDRHLVTVDETITYPNNTRRPLQSLILAVTPNLWANCFTLQSLKVNGAPLTTYDLSGHRLAITLLNALAPNSTAALELRYTLALPRISQNNAARPRLFGYSNLQLNLVDWYPFVAPNIDGNWILRDAAAHGDYLTYPLADFQVDVVFSDPTRVPIVASSGSTEQIGAITRYTLTAGRAFALSASRDYKVASMQVGDVTVSSYYFSLYKRPAEAALLASAQALQVFSQKFGPYPHRSLSVVLADLGKGAEYSGLNFQRRSYYDQYDGRPSDFLNFLTVHATAHQWWSEQVANDPALEPWLDESLATYSESLFYESIHPELVQYWWANRIDFFRPAGPVNISVYAASDDATYRRAAFYNGARFLAALRARVGDEAFFAFIRDYLARQQGEIATSSDFFDVLRAHTQVDCSDILHEYFQYQ